MTAAPVNRLGALSSFLLFVALGLAVFLPSITFSSLIPDEPETILRLALVGLGAGLWLFFRTKDGWRNQSTLYLAFGVAALALLVGWQYGSILLDALGGDLKTMRGIALAKAGSAAMTLVPIIIALPLLKGCGVDFYFGMGRRGLIGLGIGALAFFGFGFAAFGPSFADQTATQIFWGSLPWILLFVTTNALMEEILFRSLFLSSAVSVMGKHLAAIATAVVFAAAHMTVTYTPDVPVFLVILIGLGLAWAYLMIWSRSIWGSVVFHAGADFIIIGGILQTMQ